MKCFLIAVICCICIPTLAQQSKVTYNALENGNDAIPVDFKFRFIQFLPGQVFYKDGSGGAGRLNYNLLVQEIQFINEKGDTLALDHLETVRLITIGQDSFFFNKGIIEVAGRYKDVLLGVKERLKIKDSQKVGAYGMANPSGSIETYDQIRVGQGTYKLGRNENITLGKDRDYFLIVRDKLFLPLNMNNLAKAFPSKKDKLDSFAAQQKLNLNKEEDVRKVLAFCAEN